MTNNLMSIAFWTCSGCHASEVGPSLRLKSNPLVTAFKCIHAAISLHPGGPGAFHIKVFRRYQVLN